MTRGGGGGEVWKVDYPSSILKNIVFDETLWNSH